MSKKTVIDLYFDVISPYSRIAFESLLRYEKSWPIEVNLVPFFLGGVMKATGNKPPMMTPAKAIYMNKDLQRNADYWGVKLVPPKDLMETLLNRGSLMAQRFLTAIDARNKEHVAPVARELWERVWVRNETIHMISDLREAKDEMMAKIRLYEKRRLELTVDKLPYWRFFHSRLRLIDFVFVYNLAKDEMMAKIRLYEKRRLELTVDKLPYWRFFHSRLRKDADERTSGRWRGSSSQKKLIAYEEM
ncbi:Glutathione S-transferase kappa 1 [Toxocara canis]|uniref:Glutathione S-transferase kappa 1 n=1 Tax=Toxocara canis TaxID=6265 RepID=A0A0B2VMJ0_TOXCA|nr:Glutathione S-transferase kappa 1 [Toxocara canis]